jgi:hypothetical protein
MIFTDHQTKQVDGEAGRSASFVPSAYLVGSDSRPSSIVIYGVTGGANTWLRIPLDVGMPPITYVRQALAVVKVTPKVPFFGRTTGFIINFTPTRAVMFNIKGDPIETFSKPYNPGHVEVTLGKKARAYRSTP